MNHGIVVDHDNPVTGRVHVELYAVGPELDGALKRRDRVLGMCLVRPPVGDSLWRTTASACSQAFLLVVALCRMSAKL